MVRGRGWSSFNEPVGISRHRFPSKKLCWFVSARTGGSLLPPRESLVLKHSSQIGGVYCQTPGRASPTASTNPQPAKQLRHCWPVARRVFQQPHL